MECPLFHPSIYLSVHLFAYLSIHLPICQDSNKSLFKVCFFHPFKHHPNFHPFTRLLSVYPSIHLLHTHLSITSSNHFLFSTFPSVHPPPTGSPPAHPAVQSKRMFMFPITHPFACSFIYLFICWFFNTYICPSFHLSTCTFIQ